MKLAKITHYRCGEISGSFDESSDTLVWAPEDMTQEQFEEAIERARRAYAAYADEFKKLQQVEDPGWAPNYKNFPDKKVSEVDAEFAAKKAEYNAWKERYDQGFRGFGWYLKAEGFSPFWEHEPDLTAEVDWGHRHGTRIDCDTTKVSDLPGPARAARDLASKVERF